MQDIVVVDTAPKRVEKYFTAVDALEEILQADTKILRQHDKGFRRAAKLKNRLRREIARLEQENAMLRRQVSP